MNKQYDVAALGELLIDFTENGTSGQGNPVYEANPGGAPCNVLSMLNKLGHRTAFLGKVGNDIFGRQLRAAVESAGIDVSGLLTDEDVRTTLAFVETKPDGDRDFSFYRNPGADMMLREDEVRDDIIADAKIFHFGTLSMTNEPVRSATRHAIKVAKENGAILSFDPNIREPLWKDMEDARTQMAYGLSVCDILKISDNEIQWFSGKEDYTEGIHMLQQTYQYNKKRCPACHAVVGGDSEIVVGVGRKSKMSKGFLKLRKNVLELCMESYNIYDKPKR